MSKISYHPNGLGYIVLYGATSTVHVTYKRALACMLRHGLKAKFLNPPTLKAVLSRTIKASIKDTASHFARSSEETPRKKVIAIIREYRVPGTTGFDFKVVTEVKLDKQRKTVIVTGQRKRIIEGKFAHYSKNVIGDDLRQMARNVVEQNRGISLRGSAEVRDAGGIYFVPATYAEELQALSNVLEELKIGYFKALGVIRGVVEQASLFATSWTHVQREMEIIDEALEKLTTRVSSARQLKKRLERLKALFLEYAALTQMTKNTKPMLKQLDAGIVRADKKIVQLTGKKISRRRKTSRR